MAPDLPSPPFVDVPGTANFRDAGDGKTFRQGLLYRSADPSKATEEGLVKMQKDLSISHIFDLRSTPEIQRDGPEWQGVEVDVADPFAEHGMTRKWTPVFAAKDYGPEQVGLRYQHYTRTGSEGFVKAYYDIMLAGPDAYGKIFRYLAAPNAKPCLVHCTAGKDRTGVLVALLKMLVGVDKDAIGEEYALTDKGLEHLKPLFTERLLKNPALQGNKDGVANMTSSKKENMVATVDMIEKEFGGAEKYMRKYCKLNDEEVEGLRKNLAAR
ncbi:Putative tyrosine-specific protein phosphatase [Septoria linicola]|uniref:Tyrosine-specific protein phosphatase n=1 Tax=Septoria linicola TaxID=215465 RepID=A0A9Q9EJM1_9PEZI|nr:putative tyrosine-specific protein phosphatase [Septoria linicola]USW52364.1 Putative tyrosine-specific protein phosphatase [Septoria linicola]